MKPQNDPQALVAVILALGDTILRQQQDADSTSGVYAWKTNMIATLELLPGVRDQLNDDEHITGGDLALAVRLAFQDQCDKGKIGWEEKNRLQRTCDAFLNTLKSIPGFEMPRTAFKGDDAHIQMAEAIEKNIVAAIAELTTNARLGKELRVSLEGDAWNTKRVVWFMPGPHGAELYIDTTNDTALELARHKRIFLPIMDAFDCQPTGTTKVVSLVEGADEPAFKVVEQHRGDTHALTIERDACRKEIEHLNDRLSAEREELRIVREDRALAVKERDKLFGALAIATDRIGALEKDVEYHKATRATKEDTARLQIDAARKSVAALTKERDELRTACDNHLAFQQGLEAGAETVRRERDELRAELTKAYIAKPTATETKRAIPESESDRLARFFMNHHGGELQSMRAVLRELGYEVVNDHTYKPIK